MEYFKMSYTYSVSGSLNNESLNTEKVYQRETIFGKASLEPEGITPFYSLSFANGNSVTAEKEGIRYTVTLQNKDLIIEAEIIEDDAVVELEASLSDIFHSLPTVYDENGNVIGPDTEFVTATGGGVMYISIPNMVTDDPIH